MTRQTNRALRLVLVLLAVSVTATGCAQRVTRIAPEQAIDLSGRWNDVDSRVVAEALIHQSFEQAMGTNWAMRHAQTRGGQRPAVIVGTIRNRSMEHIPVNTFVRDLERAYVNSGAVELVASRQERSEVRSEREDQQEYASAVSRARLQSETGANYMLQGEIQSIEDQERGRRVVFYQVDLTLTDLESNSRVWVGQHKIKKFVSRPRLSL